MSVEIFAKVQQAIEEIEAAHPITKEEVELVLKSINLNNNGRVSRVEVLNALLL